MWIPKHFSLNNIKQAFDVMEYPKALANTAGINMVAALLQVAVTSVVGYGFARYKFRGRSLLFGLVLFTIIVPPQTTMIPMFLKFSNFDVLGIAELTRTIFGMEGQVKLINTPFVMYLPALFGMGIRSGLFIYIFRQSFRGMPKELEEAAKIDGAGTLQTIFRIFAPAAKPVIIIVAIGAFQGAWGDYMTPFMYFSPEKYPLAMALFGSVSYSMPGAPPGMVYEPLINAAAILMTIPPIIGFFFTQKHIVQGVVTTGLKG